MKEKPTAKRGAVYAPIDELVPIIREGLAAGQSIRIYPRGRSMRPLIREGRDSVTLAPLSRRLQKNDIALFCYGGRYLLHRAVAQDLSGNYIFSGDNCRGYERGVGEGDILAVVTELRRKERPTRTDGGAYLCFVFLRRKARRLLMRIKRHLARLFSGKK